MANEVQSLQRQILALALVELRPILPAFGDVFNYKYDPLPGGTKSSVEIPVPVPATPSYTITPGNLPKQAADYSTALVEVPCDKWIGKDFFLTDIEDLQVGIRSLPMQARGAVIRLANDIFLDCVTELYQNTYGREGTVGQELFKPAVAGLNELVSLTDARRRLKTQYCPIEIGQMRFFMDEFSEANALNLRAFQDVSWNPNSTVLADGTIRRPMGFDFYTPQPMPTHTAGTGAGYLVNQAGHTAGATVVTVGTGTGTLVKGDLFSVAGTSQQFVVQSFVGNALTYAPAAAVGFANGAAITKVASHKVSLAFHKNALAFVTRPLKEAIPDALKQVVATDTLVDDVTGLALTLEISRQYNQTYYEFKTLYGKKLIRPEFSTRVLS
jgi:P22 coat protein - gene protein 5